MPKPERYQVREKTAFKFRFIRPDTGKRTTIRLGVVSQSLASEFGLQLDLLIESYRYQTDVPPRTIQWLSGLSDDLYERLVSVGLVAARTDTFTSTLETFLDQYIEMKITGGVAGGGWKRRTEVNRRQTVEDLVKYFGANTSLSNVTFSHANEWKNWLLNEKDRNLSPASVSKKLKDAKQFFDFGVDAGLLEKNPFSKIKLPPQENPDRMVYVSREKIESILERIDDPEFCVVIAFARYGGFRIPSEVQALRWNAINDAEETILVRSPKLEAYAYKGQRICRLFPEITSHLGKLNRPKNLREHVIGKYADGSRSNLRTQFERFIRRAGHEPWPRIFHNLRASALTDLAEAHSLPKVCKWLGTSPATAMKHYFMLRGKELKDPADR